MSEECNNFSVIFSGNISPEYLDARELIRVISAIDILSSKASRVL